MFRKFIDIFLWGYWWTNQPFLRALAATFIGQAEEKFRPDNKAMLGHVRKFLKQAPRPFFIQVLLGISLFPVVLPPPGSDNNIARLLMRIWFVIKSHLIRPFFILSSPKSRAKRIGKVYTILKEQALQENEDIFRGIIIFSGIKSLLGGAYLDIEPTWKAMNYAPAPERGEPFPKVEYNPPSRPDVESPVSIALKKGSRSISEIAKKPDGKTTYCVIGSGAGGAIAAYSILQQERNARVILLESGKVTANKDFPTQAMMASSLLYMNAGSTVTADQRFTFRQARTVGGGTTLNNAISIKPEGFWWTENIIKLWKKVGADMPWDDLYRAYGEVEKLICVAPLPEARTTAAARTVRDGLGKVGLGDVTRLVPVNLDRCMGCGLCNLGCRYDAKRSMNVSVIPKFIADGGILVPDAHIEKIRFAGNASRRKVTSVAVETDNGEWIDIEADKFILAAGAYASTKLLWDSGFTGMRNDVRTVGKRFTCNFGSPLIGRFPERQYAWGGQQVGYVADIPEERIVIETAFAPPGVFGSLAPQWGNAFMQMVKSYDYLAVTAPTVSSLSYGQIRKANLFESGYIIDYRMSDEDWQRLSKGMKISAQAMFAMGAEEIYTTRFDATSIERGDAADRQKRINRYFDGIGPADYFKVESAHPQGGNVIHENASLGVVDNSLKVHGVDNLWICDASVIPSSITLNLQLTVMALARYAAPGIVRHEVGKD